MKAWLCSLFLLPVLATQASAKAYFQSKAEMIRGAEVIAVITITEVKVAPKDRIQDYRKSGAAKLEMLIKGEIAQNFTILGDETFICASCPIAPGRYLAFLGKNGDAWVGSNWHQSLRPIQDDKVEWYVSDDDRHDMKSADLKAVIAEIRAILETQPEEEKKP